MKSLAPFLIFLAVSGAAEAKVQSSTTERFEAAQSRLQRIREVADGWPPRLDDDEQRSQVLELWTSLDKELADLVSQEPNKYSYVLASGDCKRMGHNLDVEGAFDSAIKLLKRAGELKPSEPVPKILLGQHLVFGGRFDEGKAAFLEALPLMSDEPKEFVYFGLASAEYFSKRFPAAAEWAEKCLALEPGDKGAALILQKSREALAGAFVPGEVEIHAEGPPDGKVKTMPRIEDGRNDPRESAEASTVAEAIRLYEQGPSKAPQIIRLLSDELKRDPTNEPAVRLLGITYLGVDQYENALAQFDRAIDLAALRDEILPQMLFYKAGALFELDRCEESRKLLDVYWAMWQDDDQLAAQSESLRSEMNSKCKRGSVPPGQ